jgi:hypothetical protein
VLGRHDCDYVCIVHSEMNGEDQGRVSAEQMEHFVREGFLRIEGVVEDSKVDAALRQINHALGKPGALSSGGAQHNLGKLDGIYSSRTEIRDLLFGADGAQWLFDAFAPTTQYKQRDLKFWWGRASPQIAIRFPEVPESLFRVLATTEMVERGEAWHTDGLRKSKLHPFSLLVGVCLSDCIGDFQGNLLLWPGRHLLIHKCLNNKGGDNFLHKFNKTSMQQGQGLGKREEDYIPLNNLPSLPALGKPRHIYLKKGDIVLLHPDLPHSGGSNWGSQIRIMVYFRMQLSDDMEGHKNHAFNDFNESLRKLADRVLE